MLINYTHNGQQKQWEAVSAHDSVSILLWHTQKRSFVFVKQLRIPVLNNNKKDGMMYELCAGIVDKDIPNAQIAQEEILEECGYDIPVENLEKINSFYSNVGVAGSLQTMYYAECDESMRVNDGGGLHDEDIEVIYIPINDVKSFMFDDSYQKTTGLLMALYWFFDNKKELIS